MPGVAEHYKKECPDFLHMGFYYDSKLGSDLATWQATTETTFLFVLDVILQMVRLHVNVLKSKEFTLK